MEGIVYKGAIKKRPFVMGSFSCASNFQTASAGRYISSSARLAGACYHLLPGLGEARGHSDGAFSFLNLPSTAQGGKGDHVSGGRGPPAGNQCFQGGHNS